MKRTKSKIGVLRWILFIPMAILAWVVGDYIITAGINLMVSGGINIPLTLGYHIILFGSYFTAVAGGAFMAPNEGRIKAGIIIAALLTVYRLYMTVIRFLGYEFTPDSIETYFVGTIFALLGALLCLSLLWGEARRK